MARPARGRPDQVHGDVDPGYGPLADAFRRQFLDGREVGAACAVVRDGRLVADLWGGHRDGVRRLPWEPDTMVPVFSTTKGMATMALLVAHARGHLDVDAPVARYWPEFAQAGKDAITVRQLLAHRAGLAALDEPLTREVVADRDRLAAVLARQAPLWEPGRWQGYHAWTLGFYEGELYRRVDPAGRSIGQGFAEDVAAPLGLDFHIGLPDTVPDDRLATFHASSPLAGIVALGSTPRALLLAFLNPRSLSSRAFFALPMIRDLSTINDRDLLRLELAAVGGVGTARSIATAFGCLATGGEAIGLAPDTVAEVEATASVPPGGRRDIVLRFDLVFSLGFGRRHPGFPIGTDERAYAMAGAGGSIGMADPATGIGWSYTPNLMGFGSPTDPREVRLRDALYRAIGGPPQDPTRDADAATSAGARRRADGAAAPAARDRWVRDGRSGGR